MRPQLHKLFQLFFKSTPITVFTLKQIVELKYMMNSVIIQYPTYLAFWHIWIIITQGTTRRLVVSILPYLVTYHLRGIVNPNSHCIDLFGIVDMFVFSRIISWASIIYLVSLVPCIPFHTYQAKPLLFHYNGVHALEFMSGIIFLIIDCLMNLPLSPGTINGNVLSNRVGNVSIKGNAILVCSVYWGCLLSEYLWRLTIYYGHYDVVMKNYRICIW